MSLPQPFPTFRCRVSLLGSKGYAKHQYQYATTSNWMDADEMQPGAIIYPEHPNADADIFIALDYARRNNLSIAVRTGGHSYTGTSSCGAGNIQVDLSEAYVDWDFDPVSGILTTGVSFTLQEWNTKLMQYKRPDGKKDPLFLPTGQCSNVHIGGHIQTGGLGQLSRAFGMLADHLVSADIIVADGRKLTISPTHEDAAVRDLFRCVFGSGPGNYGIVTTLRLRPYHSNDYPYSRALKRVIPYNYLTDGPVLQALYECVVAFKDAPQDYDLCITAGSGQSHWLANMTGLANKDSYMQTWHPPNKLPFSASHNTPMSGIVVFFQYSNLDGRPDTYDPRWAQMIKDACNKATNANCFQRVWKSIQNAVIAINPMKDAHNYEDDKPVAISYCINVLWTFRGVREYTYPFIKNDPISQHQTAPQFPEWATGRLNELYGMAKKEGGLMVSMQTQQFGGAQSKVVQNAAKNYTSYHWRDGLVAGLNVFYDPSQPGAYENAVRWDATNTEQGVGPKGMIAPRPLRWFSFPTGEQDMSLAKDMYFDPASFDEAIRVKTLIDPKNMFSANKFAIRAGGFPTAASRGASAAPTKKRQQIPPVTAPADCNDDCMCDEHLAEQRIAERLRRRGITVTSLRGEDAQPSVRQWISRYTLLLAASTVFVAVVYKLNVANSP